MKTSHRAAANLTELVFRGDLQLGLTSLNGGPFRLLHRRSRRTCFFFASRCFAKDEIAGLVGSFGLVEDLQVDRAGFDDNFDYYGAK